MEAQGRIFPSKKVLAYRSSCAILVQKKGFVMDEKECFKCNVVKDLSEFYKHKQMADGHLSKCKECTKNDVGKHRVENIEKIRAYDRKRGKLPHRVSANTIRTRKFRKENPDKYKAHMAINNGKRAGLVTKKPCEVCGTTKRLESHHDDYSKPLEVRWLCSVHHSEIHKEQI